MKEMDTLEERRAGAKLGGGEKRIEAQHARGKLTARERIELARQGLVRGIRHVRRAPLDRIRHGKTKVPGDGVVTGWGTVNGRKTLFRQGFYRVRRLAVRDPRAEDRQKSRTWR
jgi:Acetyl-CoA carboxylase, carboxyltransferase component (subunits alpha and beta)